MKNCIRCNLNLDISCFSVDKQKTSGFRPECKNCTNLFQRKRRIERYEYIHKKEKEYRLANRDKINEWKRQDAIKNPDKVRGWAKKSYHKCKNKPERIASAKALYDSTREKRNIYYKDKYHNNLEYKLQLNMRRRMHKLVKRKEKGGSAVKDLGCTYEEFIIYISNKFETGMTWDNYGKWHLDHIYPLSKVDLTDRDQFLKVAHYTNYQPLWAKDNIIKSDKLPNEIKNDH